MNTKPKRAKPTRPAFGRCQDCHSVLQSLGLAPAKDFAEIASEIYCPVCNEIKAHLHAEDCGCSDCRAGIPKNHRIQT